jgi:hypothetical protein
MTSPWYQEGVAKEFAGFGSKVGFCPYTGRIRQFGDSTVAFSVARLLGLKKSALSRYLRRILQRLLGVNSTEV